MTIRSNRIATALATILLLAMLSTLGLALWFARDQAIDEWRGQFDNLALLLIFAVLIRLLKRREQDMEATRKRKLVAEAASLAKSDFLAMISHEIRTPLTSTIGFAEILARTQPGQPGGNTGATILRNGQHLLTIINDILAISRIEASRLPLEQLSFSPYELAEGGMR